MPRYKVLTPLEHNGKRIEPGKPVELEKDAAGPLLDVKAVEEWPTKAESKAESKAAADAESETGNEEQ